MKEKILSDEYYFINKNNFLKDYLPVYKSYGIEAKYLVQFPIILPFELPFKQRACMTFKLNNSCGCTLKFLDIVTSNNYFAGSLSDKPFSVKNKNTRVEMTYVSNKEINKQRDELSEKFNIMLNYLNSIITAYLIIHKDTEVFRVSNKMLEGFCIYRTIQIQNWDCLDEGLFIINPSIEYIDNKIGDKELDEIIDYSNVIINSLNPFTWSEELLLDGKHNLDHGFYKEAVFYVQSSIEVFIKTLYSELLKYEGCSEVEIEEQIEETPFITIIREKLSSRIGGYWDTSNLEKSTGKWYLDCCSLKKKVVHGGYLPKESEVVRAYESAIQFRIYITTLIMSKKSKYTDLSSHFLK